MDDKLQKVEQAGALAEIPKDLVEDAGRGTESIGSEDVRPPRLVLCQSGTPQRKRGNAKFIPGLEEHHLFNDLTEEVYGEGPVKFVVVSRLGARYVEFDKANLGVVIDGNVAANDPRTQFTTATEDSSDGKIKAGQRVKPIATKFEDYLIFLPESQELVAFSMHGMQLKIATKLNSLIKLPMKIGNRLVANPPAWARVLTVQSVPDTKGEFSFSNLKISQVGPADDETRRMARTLNEYYAKVNVVIEREPGDETEFPPVVAEVVTDGM